MSPRFILLTGCSGGGKSTLLRALGKRGFATVPEPGRRVVADEMTSGGEALPWVDMQAFARRTFDLAKSDLEAANRLEGIVFFDRGLIDAAVALAHAGGAPVSETLGRTRQYERCVFLAPPWRETFAQDAARRHDFDTAVQEYVRIEHALAVLGYSRRVLPKVSVEDRIRLVLSGCGVP